MISEVSVAFIGDINGDVVIKSFAANSAPSVGEQLNHADYEKFKDGLQNLALRYGYVDSRFDKQQLQVNVAKNIANIQFVFDGGHRYIFGSVEYESENLEESYLARYQLFAEGQPFDSQMLVQLQQTLINTRFFDEVSVVQLEPNPDTLKIPTKVTLNETSKYVSSVGVGAATDTGPRAKFTFENNRVNGVGHQYGINLAVSEVTSGLDVNYKLPLSRPAAEKIQFKAGLSRENTDTSENDVWFVGASHSDQLTRNWVRNIDLIYQGESYTIGSTRDSNRLLIPSVNWQLIKADNLAYPKRGLKLQGGVRGAADVFGSDVSFVQLTASAKYVFGVGRSRFLARAEAGSTLIAETIALPASVRFFAGGDNSVRGFDYKALGPLDSEGEVEGGKHLLAASLEYEYAITDKYGLAVFYDLGNAFDDSEFQIERSIGVGARWHSAIGPIRVDLAFPQTAGGSFRLHLSMGPDL
jgi:translocation and assembly module TamA